MTNDFLANAARAGCTVAMTLWFGQAQAVDYVPVEIRCEGTARISLDWPNSLGSDPALNVDRSSAHSVNASFQSIRRDGQKVTCAYGSRNNDVIGSYSYTVRRAIRRCDPPNGRVLNCEVRADN